MLRTLKDLTEHVEAEAVREGKDAIAELRRFRAYFRLAQELAKRRVELGLTQQEVSKRSGIRQSEISKIESGGANPTVHTLNAIAVVLGAEVGLRDAGQPRAKRQRATKHATKVRATRATQAR
jgi:DNA-binding XRE family transcriptional regulator